MSAPATPTAPTSLGGNSTSAPSGAKSVAETSATPGSRTLLIYEADVGLRVKEPEFPATIEAIIDAAESRGGYLISRTDRVVKVRVPSGSLRSMLSGVSGLGDVTHRSVSAEDVSSEVHDLEVRLKNLQGVRDRLEQLLTRAKDVTEALTVGKELESVAQQIDLMQGRLSFLRTRAAMSLVTVTLEPVPTVAPPPPPSPRTAPPGPRSAHLPIEWLPRVGLDGLLDLP